MSFMIFNDEEKERLALLIKQKIKVLQLRGKFGKPLSDEQNRRLKLYQGLLIKVGVS